MQYLLELKTAFFDPTNAATLLTSFLAPTTVVALIAILAFVHSRRKERIDALERSFELLQDFNTVALSSDANVLAVMQSAMSDDNVNAEEGRKVIIQFMRINRMLRAWQSAYRDPKILKETDADTIVDSYVGTLFEYESKLDRFMQRGYPPEFEGYLRKRIKKVRAEGLVMLPFGKP